MNNQVFSNFIGSIVDNNLYLKLLLGRLKIKGCGHLNGFRRLYKVILYIINNTLLSLIKKFFKKQKLQGFQVIMQKG